MTKLLLRALCVTLLVASAGASAAQDAPAGAKEALRLAAEESRSEDLATRLRGIRSLAELPGAAPIEALRPLLRAEPGDAKLREESWYEAARALWRLSVHEPLPAPVLADLRALAERAPEVTYRFDICHSSVQLPRWDFPEQARAALRSEEYNRERRALDRAVASLPPAQEIAALSAVAWGPGPKASDHRRNAARVRLGNAGTAGLDAALAALPAAPDPIQRQMVDYFGQAYRKTRDPRSVDGIAALMDSPSEEIWEPAYSAAGRMVWEDAVPVLMAKLGAGEADERRGAALGILAEGVDPSLAPIFAAYLDAPDPYLRELAARTLPKLGDEGLRRLSEAASGASPEGRRTALEQLWVLAERGPAMERKLAELLPPELPVGALLHAWSDDPALRGAALRKLAVAPDERSIEILHRVVSRRYGSDAERLEAWTGAAEVGYQLALQDAFSPLSEDSSHRLRSLMHDLVYSAYGDGPHAAIARNALEQLGDSRKRGRVRHELTQPRGERIASVAWTDESPTARDTALQLLAAEPNGVALSRAMIPKVQSPSVIQKMAPYFEAAYATAPEDAAGALVDLVGTQDGLRALQVLGRLRPTPAVSAALIARLEEEDERELREAAFPALVAMGDPAAIDYVLERGLYDGQGYGHIDTSRKAAEALATLGPRGHELLFAAVENGGYLAQRAALESLLASGDPGIRASIEGIGRTARDRGLQLLVRGLLDGE